MSGGEQQRLSLALALVGRPDVLFLDEPTAGVDPEGRIAVRDDHRRPARPRGICVVLTTHELAEAERLADRVVIIDHGRMLAEGTPAELASAQRRRVHPLHRRPGIDTARCSVAGARGRDVTVDEERARAPTGSARRPVRPPRRSSPPWPGGWPSADLALGDLRTGPVPRGGLPGHHRLRAGRPSDPPARTR